MTAPITREPTRVPRLVDADRPEAVSAGRESWLQWLKLTLLNGGPGQCIFAINNACNAGCEFCNFALDVLPRADWRYVRLDDARRAIDVLSNLFIRYLIVSGGEPTLHPHLDAILHPPSRSQHTHLAA